LSGLDYNFGRYKNLTLFFGLGPYPSNTCLICNAPEWIHGNIFY
jgi:hypothetical protein